jgi:hypothetical protein
LATIGSVIADIRTTIRGVNHDTWVSPRYIYNILMDFSIQYVRQKKNLKNMFSDSAMVKYLNCVETTKVYDKCCGTDPVTRTKDKITDLLSMNEADGILYVTAIDNGKSFSITNSPLTSNKAKARRFGAVDKNVYFNDGYFYFTDSDPKAVNIAYVKNPADELATLEASLAGTCKSIYDEKFPITEDLLVYAKMDTVRFIMSTLLGIRPDENPNQDSNEPSKTNPVNI